LQVTSYTHCVAGKTQADHSCVSLDARAMSDVELGSAAEPTSSASQDQAEHHWSATDVDTERSVKAHSRHRVRTELNSIEFN